MIEMNKEIIDSLDREAHNSLNINKINDNLYLSKKQMEVLERYDIDYKGRSIEALMYEIDDILNNSYEDLMDQEDVSKEIAEFNYYHNTKK